MGGADMSSKRPAVLVIEHEPDAGPGLLTPSMERAGVRLELRRPYEGDAVGERVEVDGLVVLGGAMGAADDAEAPWLPAVRSLLAEAVRAGVPTLGICLGAQLLALAGGGRVERGAVGPEIGVSTLELTEEGRSDPLFATLGQPRAREQTSSRRPSPPEPPQPIEAAQWHLDAIVSLPSGAVLLARNDSYEVQAFRIGGRCWGVQFHPEVDHRTVKAWAGAETSPELSAARLAAAAGEVQSAEARLEATWSGFFARFAAVVTDP